MTLLWMETAEKKNHRSTLAHTNKFHNPSSISSDVYRVVLLSHKLLATYCYSLLVAQLIFIYEKSNSILERDRKRIED